MLWVGTSWKMNKTLAEASDYATRLAAALADGAPAGVQPFIIPPATALTTVRVPVADMAGIAARKLAVSAAAESLPAQFHAELVARGSAAPAQG